MAHRPLPPELTSLVHHIELNKEGWWDRAIQRLILAVIWLSSEALSIQSIITELEETFQVDLELGRAMAAAESLRSTGVVVRLPNESFKISESSLGEFEGELKEAEAIEKGSKDVFMNLLVEHCPSLTDGEQVWRRFNEQFLLPFVQSIGANTYNLITAGDVKIDEARLSGLFEPYPKELHSSLHSVVKSFLDPTNRQIRSYVLRALNAYFFIEAVSIREDTLDVLTKLGGQQPEFIVFGDTNFLFSIIGFHDNPSNEAAQSLVRLIAELKGKVRVKLYALPPTLDEMKRVIIAKEQSLRGLRLTANLAKAALETSLDGTARKFVEESRNRGFSVSAESYFEVYNRDLLSILRAKGVEFFNEDLTGYKKDQNVVDDILERMEFYKKRTVKTKIKTYEQVEHDMILWRFVKDKRPAYVESPLDAKYWITTIDYGFLGFDAYKRHRSTEGTAICLLPSTLIHMLQFWVPRTAQFEEAMLSSMRLPFFFQEFDRQAERTTIRILEALGRFENIGDLSNETITAILVNDALRQKLFSERNLDKQVELIKEALIEQSALADQKLKELSQEAKSLEAIVSERDTRIGELLERTKNQEATLRETEDRLRAEKLEKDSLGQRLLRLEDSSRFQEGEAEKRARRLSYVTRLAVYLLFMIILGACGVLIVLRTTNFGIWKTILMISSLLAILLIWLADRRGLRDPIINDWQLFKRIHSVKNWLLTVLWTILLSVLGNAVYGWIRENWPS
jgi:hypothetical protein